MDKVAGIFKQLTPAEIKSVKKTGLAPSRFSGKLTKDETELLVHYCRHPILTTFFSRYLEEEKGEGTARLSEGIKIEIERGRKENSYSLTIGDSTAHDIPMAEALMLIKEEMEKPPEGEGVEMVHCVECGRAIEPVAKGRIILTCSEACSQKWYRELVRGLMEWEERSERRWESLLGQLR